MGIMTTHQAYPLPDDPEPDEFTCHRVYLPVGSGFERAFFGSIAHLEKWVAWERDDDHNAVKAAQSMKIANGMTMDAWSSLGCVVVLEPPYTENTPDGRTPEEATIDVWFQFVYDEVVIIVDRIDEGATVDDVIAERAPFWEARTGSPGIDILGEIATEIAAHTPAEREAALDTDLWLAARDNTLCQMADDCPTIAEIDEVFDWYDWLNCAAGKIYSTLNDLAILNPAAYWLFDALNSSAAFLSGQGSAEQVEHVYTTSGGSSFGFGSAVCQWVHTFDFTTGQHGFVAHIPPGETAVMGSWLSGEGWNTSDGFSTDWKVAINRSLAFSATVTKIEFSGVTAGTAQVCQWYEELDYALFLGGSTFGGPGPFAGAINATREIEELVFYFRERHVGQGHLSTLTITGQGINDPFA